MQVLACQYMLIWREKKCQRGWHVVGLFKLLSTDLESWMEHVICWWNCHSNLLKASIERQWGNTHAHTAEKDMTYQALCDFFLCRACRKPPDGKERSQQKGIWSLVFFPVLYFSISSSDCEWNPIRSQTQIVLLPAIHVFFSCSYSASSDHIWAELKLFNILSWCPLSGRTLHRDFAYGPSVGGSPSLVPAFRPKPRRFPPPKINVCESICCVCVCVCQGFVRQISPACTALVLLNQASITRPLWIM